MRIFGEITKLEPQGDGTLKVLGVASSGAVDEADERVSPAAMKAALPAYLRFGALREMHGLSAAGATLGAEVGEDGLTRIEAHVVDPVAVKKVRLGVYKGFSIGGRVIERDPGDPKLITALRLDEISLVDRPCNPEAVIEMWKADRHAAPAPTNTEVIAKAIELAAAAGRRGRYTDYVVKAREALLAQVPVAARLEAPAGPADPLYETLDLLKQGARNSQADLARIQAAHDELVALGAQCGPAADDDDDLDDDGQADPCDREPLGAWRGPDAPSERGLARALGGPTQDLEQEVMGLRQSLADLRKRLDDLAARPIPPRTLGGWARAVSKVEDAGADPGPSPEVIRKYLESLTPQERAQLELRAALSRPIAVTGR